MALIKNGRKRPSMDNNVEWNYNYYRPVVESEQFYSQKLVYLQWMNLEQIYINNVKLQCTTIVWNIFYSYRLLACRSILSFLGCKVITSSNLNQGLTSHNVSPILIPTVTTLWSMVLEVTVWSQQSFYSTYWWLNAKLLKLLHKYEGVTIVLHQAIELYIPCR